MFHYLASLAELTLTLKAWQHFPFPLIKKSQRESTWSFFPISSLPKVNSCFANGLCIFFFQDNVYGSLHLFQPSSLQMN